MVWNYKLLSLWLKSFDVEKRKIFFTQSKEGRRTKKKEFNIAQHMGTNKSFKKKKKKKEQTNVDFFLVISLSGI